MFLCTISYLKVIHCSIQRFFASSDNNLKYVQLEGTTWNRKATDRSQWKTLMEGYILQWMDKA